MAPASFSPTQSETALVNQIFSLFDAQKFGILTGDVAIKAFAGANLPPTTLGEIWNIADEDNNGWLSRKGVSIAVRLMGWAQRGEKVSKELLGRPGPLPTIDGIPIVTQQNTGLSLPKSPPPPASLPPLTVQDRTKFHSLFYKAGPQNGLISGEKARGVFLKSKLSTDQLLQIWNLADTQDRGALDITDFTIGMYFIQAVMSRQLSVIPLSLPPGLYQQAASHTQSKGSHLSNNSGSFSPVGSTFSQSKPSAVQPQYTGQNVLQPNYTGISPPKAPSSIPSRSPASPFTASPFGQPAAQNIRWDVSPSEKIVADRYFDDMDVNKRGYVDGDAAVPFMLKSGLGSEDLARIWDLADLDNNGQLTRDGFAVAMYLIQKRIAGQELPEVLPLSLIPPSMRNGNIHTVTQQRSPEPVTDLFSFDDTPAVPSQSTGSIVTLQPQQTGPKLASFAPPSIPPRAATNDPFSQHQDLLGDDDSDSKPSSPPLHDKSAEIGNTQNQLSSTNRSLETVKNDRQSAEQIVANQEAQLSALQTQLFSAKAAYETETRSLATLKERQMNQLTEIQKSREELIHAESNLSAVRVEKAELEGVFLRDKEEARELHRKMMEAGQEAEKFKQELERAKKEAKQQKGLLAIARKQLSTKESERAKLEKEVEEATNEVTSLVAEREIVEVELAKDIDVIPMITGPQRTLSPDSVTFAAQHPLPSTPDISNTGTVARSNNPFGKLTASSSIIEANGAAQPTFPPDMFSFDKVFDTDENTNTKVPGEGGAPQPASSTNGVAEHTESTPKAQPVDLGVFSPHSDTFFSPAADSEHFVTPPSSATERSRVASPDPYPLSTQESRRTDDAKSNQSSEGSAAHFPPIEDINTPFVESPKPGALSSDQENAEQKSQGQSTETDLNTELKELDAEESDSDSDDEVPLSELAKIKPTAQDKDAVVPADKRAEPSAKTFDDIFEVPVAAEPTPRIDEASQPPADSNNPAAHNAFDAFGAPTSPFETSLTGTSTTVPFAADNTGISAFDEALKLMPTRNGTGASNSVSDSQQFSSDATFDEFFVFPSPSASAPPSAIPVTFPPTTDVNGSIPPTRADDDFNLSPPPKLPPIAQDRVKSFTFEEAFSGFESNPSADAGSLAAQAATPSSPAPPGLEPASSRPFPSSVPASPQSMSPPRGSTGYPETSLRSSSPAPQRTKLSNPPRGPSPKSPRPSTSSSKDDKPGNIPTRHSKLSIRLPFGRKKKQQQQQQNQEAQQTAASQPQLLSAPQEQAGLNRTVSPGGDQDVQPVKQLVSLGFDRAKAIEALERNGYDFQKALDILVGSQ